MVALLVVISGCSDQQALFEAKAPKGDPIGLSINTTDLKLAAGQAGQLTVAGKSGAADGVTWTSSQTEVARVDGSGRVLGLSAGIATVTARRGTETVQALVRVAAEGERTALKLTPAETQLGVGGSDVLELLLLDENGVPVKYEDVDRWEVLDPSVARVQGGVVTGLKEGETEVVAVSGDKVVTSSVKIIRFPKPQLLLLDPARLPVSNTEQMLRVQGRYFQSGSLVVVNGVAYPSTYVNSSEIRAVVPASLVAEAGLHKVLVRTATGITSNAMNLTVAAIAPASIGLSQTTATLNVGQSVTITAQVRDSASNVMNVPVTWSTSAGAIASVDGGGRITGVSAGTATITAVAGPASAQVQVSVVGTNPAPVATSLNPATATAGAAAFTLRVLGSGFVNGAEVRWNGSARTTTYVGSGELQAAITAADVATAGTAAVTVFNPAPGGGTSAPVGFTITQVAPTVATVTITPAALTLAIGDTVRITATPRDPQGNVVSGRTITYGTGNAAIATVSASGLVRAVANGATVVGASVDGQVGTASLQVSTATLPAPATITATTASTTQVNVSWSAVSGAAAYLLYRNGALVQTVTGTTAQDAGLTAATQYSYTVRARDAAGQLGALSATATATTQAPAAVATVSANPASYTFTDLVTTLQITMTARDAQGAVIPGVTYTWSTTNAAVATVSATGVITPRGEGSASITARATCCTAAATIPITVNLQPQEPGNAFFNDGFETFANGASVTGAGANGFRWGGANYARVTTEIARSGTRSLKFFFGPTEPDGSSHWWSEQRFDLGELVRELWLEFYIYLPNGQEGLGSAPYIHSGTQNNKLTSLWGYLNSAPTNVDAGYNNGAFILFQTWGINGGPEASVNLNVQDRYPGGSTPIFTNARRGTWVQWRQHSRMSSARGVADGLVEYWINGQLGQRHANIVVQPTSTDYAHGWRHGYLMGYDNARFTQNTWIYVDDVRFYTSNPGW